MHLNSAELTECAYANRWGNRHAGEKLWLAGGMLVLTIALPPYPVAMLVIVLMITLTLGWARVRVGLFARVVVVPLGFACLSATTLLVSISPASWQCRFAADGLATAAQTLLRSSAAVTCLSFLMLTTPLSELLALLRRAGLPAELCELALVMQRFTWLLVETATTMWQAQTARGGWSSAKRARLSFALLVTQLFLRSLHRARQCELGLQARGYDGELRVLDIPRTTSRTAWCLIGTAHASLLLLGLYVR